MPNGTVTRRGESWRARYRDHDGKQHQKTFRRKVDAQKWLRGQLSALDQGVHVDPAALQLTIAQWCELWLEGYGTKRESTVRQARVHVRVIVSDLGSMKLAAIRPSHVKAWTKNLQDRGYSQSYVFALHSRLSQVLSDAVYDRKLGQNPCSKRTSPGQGPKRAYVASTEQVWALHNTVRESLRPAILLGAFAGLRVGEVCGLRVSDVDFMRGIVTPALQYPDKPLKSDDAETPIPIPRAMAVELSKWAGESGFLLTNMWGDQLHPRVIEDAVRNARMKIDGMPADFRFHDLRHFYASMLIAGGSDVKVVQSRLRHALAKTTLDTYAHLWPDSDESTREIVGDVFDSRVGTMWAEGVV